MFKPMLTRQLLRGAKYGGTKRVGLRQLRRLSLRTPSSRYSHRVAPLVALTLGLGFAGGLVCHQNIANDTSKIVLPSVNVDSSIDPLPLIIEEPLETRFHLIGWGIRTVSFLHMKVYALGIYVAQEDLSKVKTIFNSPFLEHLYEKPDPELPQKQALTRALEDDELSTVLVDNLLASGVKFTARICALRNTDLGHLRDGFIRTIKNSSQYKAIMKQQDEQSDRLTEGLDRLRAVLNSYHMKAYKNSRIFMEIIDGGKIKVSIKVYDAGHFRPPVVMGVVEEPMISQILFSSYLSGPTPLVAEVKQTAAESFKGLF